MVTHEIVSGGHLHRVVVTRGAAGWEVRVERDNELVRTSTHSDWHKVERAVRVADASAGVPEPADPHSTNR
jgi:hypothetical protein